MNDNAPKFVPSGRPFVAAIPSSATYGFPIIRLYVSMVFLEIIIARKLKAILPKWKLLGFLKQLIMQSLIFIIPVALQRIQYTIRRIYGINLDTAVFWF